MSVSELNRTHDNYIVFAVTVPLVGAPILRGVLSVITPVATEYGPYPTLF
jgi:hypothetical protein